MKSVVVVGGLNLDVCGMPDGALVPRDSNIGTVVLRAGGVGHNIAARLAEKGVPVELVAALGDDGAAGMLSARCAEEKIGLRYALRLHGASCCYLSLHEADGDMAAAVNAMKLMDAFTPDRLPMDAINASSLCVLDTNLPAETLERLAACATVPLLADPVSCAKADRARAVLPRLTAIKPNLMEARYLSGETEPARAAAWLLSQGTKMAFISLGREGVYFAGPDDAGVVPAPQTTVHNATGAGDAMAAGVALGLLDGLSARGCAESGVRSAAQYLKETNK